MTDALRALGWDEDWAAVREGLDLPPGRPGRVTAQHRDRWIIATSTGPREARLAGTSWSGPRPVTGDWVVAGPGPQPSDPWGLVAVLPRRSEVCRGAAGESQPRQVLASNVDRLWVVQALDRPPNLRSLERYLAVAWESGASPEIVLTKSDLAEDLEGAIESVREIAFGVPIWVISVSDEEALVSLRESLLPGETVALLGPSGAGKSTLVNGLANAAVAQTGDVRAGDRKGRHTTTGRELFALHGGALLLDTPGMRELRVLDLEAGLEHTFPDIDDLAANCRFRDCSHRSEPGCAVRAAVDAGQLSEERLASYRKLQAEVAYERRRADPLAQAEHLAQWKTAVKTLKYHPKHRPSK